MRLVPLKPCVPLLLALALPLAGCHLIDQTDFDPKPPPVAAPPPIPDPETRAALVTIDYATATPDYRAALAAAIQAAESRRPNLLYDVVAVVGTAAEAPAARVRAAEAMTVIEAQGVVASRIQLGLAIEPGRKVPRVRVYLR